MREREEFKLNISFLHNKSRKTCEMCGQHQIDNPASACVRLAWNGVRERHYVCDECGCELIRHLANAALDKHKNKGVE